MPKKLGKYVTVTITAETEGTLGAGTSANGSYLEGTSINLIATASDGYKFTGWEQTVNNGTTYNTTMQNTETLGNNALLRAKKYGQDLGGIGRLLTYAEANTGNSTNCLFGTSYSDPLRTVLYGRYTETEKVGGSSGNGCLYYWLASSSKDNNSAVWCVNGDRRKCFCLNYDNVSGYGVRAIVEIYESAVQEV